MEKLSNFAIAYVIVVSPHERHASVAKHTYGNCGREYKYT